MLTRLKHRIAIGLLCFLLLVLLSVTQKRDEADRLHNHTHCEVHP